ncbi:peptidoglycan/LPS O-acetylase OafA/YrhL [Agromyces terreus]|uniref:Peptidoglycan/LPS O-acetylase OafA/YrhL n=1 Tax=Agromyces terreus TaxID=424795 RepID=A0A9X2H157_9MICO|nr:acyltransferase [Agromyces terreus]MCP2371296.1 peptidoglycan/LPS O-acetylase OafA/YrhL [Agromyces terreus]
MASTPVGVVDGSRRLDSLTGLRWWAAFAVFGHHMLNFVPLPGAAVISLGHFGVAFFFVLSGFVLTWSARATTTMPTFWWRRFARIYPANLVALLIAIPVFYSFAPDPAQWWVKPFDLGILLLSVFLLQGWSRDPVILFSGNPAAWTLTCEAFFYALHPFINRVLLPLRLRGSLIAAGIVVVVMFAYRASVMAWPGSWAAQLPLPVSRLSEFVLGMCLASAMLAGWRVRVKPIACYVLGGAFLVWIGISGHRESVDAVTRFFLSTSNEWIVMLCAITIAAVARRDLVGGFSLLRSKLLVMLGDWSYAFYLVHATIIYALLAVVGRQPAGWGALGWTALLLILSLAAAAALHIWIERPFERRMRRWWDDRQRRRRSDPTAARQAKADAPVG